jgi:hypothetical protein
MIVALAVLAQAQTQPQPLQVAPATLSARANQPQACAAPDGTVYLCYGVEGQIYVQSSRDQGRTFSDPVAVVAAPMKMALGHRRGPRIAANKDRVVVSAVYGAQGGGKDGDLLAWRSPDKGKTWDGPEEVSDEPGSAREGLHAMGAGLDNAFVAVWLDLRSGKTVVMGSFSSTGGRTWGKNKIVYQAQEGSVCECCHPSLGFGPFGEVGAMFRNSVRGDRDMWLATSPDGGRSWATSTKLGTQTWTVAQCPMDGGAFTFNAAGDPLSVWKSNSMLYLGRGMGAVELAQGRDPWIAQTKNGAICVWEVGTSVYVQTGTDVSTRRRLTDSGSEPVVVALKEGALVTWRGLGPSGGIYVVRL